jgi:rhodanese-related sulfurtransferase
VDYFNNLNSDPNASSNIIPAAKAKELIDASEGDDLVVLSIRQAADYAANHIPGAINIPWAKGMQEAFSTLPKDVKIITYCYSGQTAGQAVAILRLLGYDAASLKSGMGTPVTAPSGWMNEVIEKLLVENGATGPTHVAWEKRNYVDSFGDPTEKPYITNIGRIDGTFSNTATSDSPLGVYFIIDDLNNIEFKLFEYDRNNPVKSYGSEKYKLLVKDTSGVVHNLTGTNYSDRITLNESSSNILHDLFIENDYLKFHVVETDNRTTTYDFEVDARGYGYIYKEFLNK